MSPRFITNMLFLVAGGFIVVCSQAFASGITAWITFGVALGLLTVLSLAQFARMRGLVQHALDALMGVLGIWTVVASVVFSGATVTWLSFAEGIGLACIALAGLVLHELTTERVVHSLAPVEARAEQYGGAAA